MRYGVWPTEGSAEMALHVGPGGVIAVAIPFRQSLRSCVGDEPILEMCRVEM